MSETTSVEMCPDCGRRIAPDCEAGTYGCKRRFAGYHSLCAELTVERFRDENAKLRSEVESLRAKLAAEVAGRERAGNGWRECVVELRKELGDKQALCAEYDAFFQKRAVEIYELRAENAALSKSLEDEKREPKP